MTSTEAGVAVPDEDDPPPPQADKTIALLIARAIGEIRTNIVKRSKKIPVSPGFMSV